MAPELAVYLHGNSPARRPRPDILSREGLRGSVQSRPRRQYRRQSATPEERSSSKLGFLPHEREILVAGGMLKYLRGGGQQRIGIVEGDSASAESGGSESGGRS
jgi:hypothetical protein